MNSARFRLLTDRIRTHKRREKDEYEQWITGVRQRRCGIVLCPGDLRDGMSGGVGLGGGASESSVSIEERTSR
jgi:hypothetical protein